MKRILHILALTMLLASCSSEEVKNPPDNSNEEMARINLCIPNNGNSWGTRAVDIDEEGYMSNLYVIAVKVFDWDESNNTFGTTELNPRPIYIYPLNIYPGVVDGDYQQYPVELYPGKYRFYVTANIDLYLRRFTSIGQVADGDELRSIVLTFSPDTRITTAHIPMACYPEDIKYGSSEQSLNSTSAANNYTIEIRRGNTYNLYAQLQFLCSKVRYTIMYDNTEGGISEQFGNQSIRFMVDYEEGKPSANASKMRRQTAFIDGNPLNFAGYVGQTADEQGNITGDIASWNLVLDRYNWPEDGADYPKKPSDQLRIWEGSVEDWMKSRKKVWQGITYLPENMLENDDQKTVLTFPYLIGRFAEDGSVIDEVTAETPKRIVLFGNDNESGHNGASGNNSEYNQAPDPTTGTSSVSHGLRRGYFYDVVALVKTPDPEAPLELKVHVYVKPWEYEPAENEW